MQKSESINELATALAKAQGEFSAAEREHVAKVVSKKGEGSSYSYNYADLAAYLDVCRAPLSKNGLAVIQSAKVEGARCTVTTTLLHGSGQWMEFDPLTMDAADMMPQSIGSIITYARRYSLSAAIGMASEADDDANTGQGNSAETGRKESNLPPCPKCGTNKSTIVGKPEYGGGFLCFAKKGGCGEKWQAGEKPKEPEPTIEPIDATHLTWLEDFKECVKRADYRDALNELREVALTKPPAIRKLAMPVWLARAKTYGWTLKTWVLAEGESGWVEVAA